MFRHFLNLDKTSLLTNDGHGGNRNTDAPKLTVTLTSFMTIAGNITEPFTTFGRNRIVENRSGQETIHERRTRKTD